MRLISQDKKIDLPYERVAVNIFTEKNKIEVIAYAVEDNDGDSYFEMAKYSTEEKALKVMEMLRNAYCGKFVTNADVSDDFNEQLKELMKNGFGAVVVKDTNDSRVEFNNLNGYFQFPADEEVEV